MRNFGLFGVLMLVLTLLVAPGTSAAAVCAPGANEVVCENSKPGTDPEIWDIWGAGDETIQGFATDISVDRGKRIDFKIDTDASAYSIEIYRTGWYQGLGARKIADVQPSASLPQLQPECLRDLTTELTDCGTWGLSASWNVPTDAVSGVYLAKLSRTDTGGSSHITFIVRNDQSHSDVVFQTSDPTWHAYNTYGGSDFYRGAANGRAYKLSYNRPFATRDGVEARDFYFGSEYPLVRYLERNGYDVSYISGVDTDRHGELLTNHNVFLSVGHDEYWSGAQRSNVEEARDAGLNLQFLTGNEVYWRTRYEPSTTAVGSDYRTLVTYKETWGNAKIDPSEQWTGTWRDPRFASPENGGGMPENALTGTAYKVNFGDFPVTVNSQEGKMRLWRDTELASLPAGTSKELAPHTVGYESNEVMAENGFRPPGQFLLSTTTGMAPQILTDFGNSLVEGETTHHLTMYKAASGASVFSAGSIQWTWGLDATHDGDGAPADVRMQQAQANLLADMGALPTTLMSSLTMPTASTDTTAPHVTVATGPAMQTSHGSSVSVTGTATDTQGVVTAVEYSTDEGASWKVATGTAEFSFTYSQPGMGDTELLVRAVDDSGNYDARGTAVPLSVPGPYSVFGHNSPANPDSKDGSSVELGLQFTPTVDGHVTGVRFYKSEANTGQHTGSLWSASGSLLARVTFSAESASGWQEAVFDQSVAVNAGTKYVVSYAAPNGRYSGDNWFFAYRGIDQLPLRVAGGFGTQPAGVYNTSSGFPESSYQQGNYYVDALFQPMAAVPLQATAQTPRDTAQSVMTGTNIGATFSKPVDAASVAISVANASGQQIAGNTSYDADTRRAMFAPSTALDQGTEYTATISAQDPAGNTVTAGSAWTFRTVLADGDCPCGIYTDSEVPDIAYINDHATLTLGTRFSVDRPGTLTGLKYYRDVQNPGPHTGRLYATNGTVLAEVQFGTDSVSGWQYQAFDEPLRLTPDTQYVASYTTTGPYSANLGEFTDTTMHGPVRTQWESGQYSYSNGYPSATTSTSYLIDVAFDADALPLAVQGYSPQTGSVDVATATIPAVTFNAPLDSGYAASATGSLSGDLAGNATLSSDGKKLSFTPSAPLPAGESITVTMSGLKSAEGATLDPVSWTFSTMAADGTPSSFLGDTTPEQLNPSDFSPISLGLRLTAQEDIEITALRYFRTAQSTGTHTGTVWSSGGQTLGSATFAEPSTTGWQTALLDTPVSIASGSTFTVSYFAPQGGYAFTPAGFEPGAVSGALTLSGNNGVYRYGDGTTMPDSSWNSTNYFADLIYQIAGGTEPSISPSPSAEPSAEPSTSSSPSTSIEPSTVPEPSPTATTTEEPVSSPPAVSETPQVSITPTPSPTAEPSPTPDVILGPIEISVPIVDVKLPPLFGRRP